jgi:hypothetical protein
MDYPWVEKNTHTHTRLGSGQVHVHTRVKNRTHARPHQIVGYPIPKLPSLNTTGSGPSNDSQYNHNALLTGRSTYRDERGREVAGDES